MDDLIVSHSRHLAVKGPLERKLWRNNMRKVRGKKKYFIYWMTGGIINMYNVAFATSVPFISAPLAHCFQFSPNFKFQFRWRIVQCLINPSLKSKLFSFSSIESILKCCWLFVYVTGFICLNTLARKTLKLRGILLEIIWFLFDWWWWKKSWICVRERLGINSLIKF